MESFFVWGLKEIIGLSNMNKQLVDELNKQFVKAAPQEILNYLNETYHGEVCLASSLGAEDQVLTDMFCNISDQVDIFVLDTGRLPPETYAVMDKTMNQYAFNYHVYFPKAEDVEKMVQKKGPNLFYKSIENRKECCYVRKVEPLQRALKDFSVWITGIRRAQSIDRAMTEFFEWDDSHQMMKVNPLAYWSKDNVWDYIKRHDVPYNDLHDRGFVSIGCEPCTRAIQPGDDERAGRWWWEDATKKECGLHVSSIKRDSMPINKDSEESK